MANTNNTVTSPAPTLNSTTATSAAPRRYINQETNALVNANHRAETNNLFSRTARNAQASVPAAIKKSIMRDLLYEDS